MFVRRPTGLRISLQALRPAPAQTYVPQRVRGGCRAEPRVRPACRLHARVRPRRFLCRLSRHEFSKHALRVLEKCARHLIVFGVAVRKLPWFSITE
jgi:hypothetical protein